MMNSGWISPSGAYHRATIADAEEVAVSINHTGGIALELDGWVFIPNRPSQGVPTRFDGNPMSLEQLLELMWLGHDLKETFVYEEYIEPSTIYLIRGV